MAGIRLDSVAKDLRHIATELARLSLFFLGSDRSKERDCRRVCLMDTWWLQILAEEIINVSSSGSLRDHGEWCCSQRSLQKRIVVIHPFPFMLPRWPVTKTWETVAGLLVRHSPKNEMELPHPRLVCGFPVQTTCLASGIQQGPSDLIAHIHEPWPCQYCNV